MRTETIALLLMFAAAATSGYAARTLVADRRRWIGAFVGFFFGLLGLALIWLVAGRSAASDARRRAASWTAVAVVIWAAAVWAAEASYDVPA